MTVDIFQKKFRTVLCCVLGLCLLPVEAYAQDSAPAIDETAAQAIALADAGVEEADAGRIRTRRDREDGEEVIEVDFFYEDNEYEYVIRTWDSMILEWSIEGRDLTDAVAELYLAQGPDGAQQENGAPQEDGQTAGADPAAQAAGTKITADGTELIGLEAAKEAVLEDSGMAEEDLTKMQFEYDGRYYDYKFELRQGRAEYEYTVDGETGEIVEAEMD